MKNGQNRLNGRVAAAVVIVMALALGSLAGPPVWKYRTVTWPVVVMSASNQMAVAGASIESVRAVGLSNNTNTLGVAVSVWSAADGWAQTLADVSNTSTNELDTYTNVSWRVEVTNGWPVLPADWVRLDVTGAPTNGTVTVGYWYYE